MIDFSISNEEYLNDLMELIRPFESRSDEDVSIAVEYENIDGVFKVKITSDKFGGFVKNYAFKIDTEGELERKRVEKRYLKIAIYRTLSFLLNVNLPYGCLTGIRPTKLYCEIENDADRYSKSARDVFLKDYSVSEGKVELIQKICCPKAYTQQIVKAVRRVRFYSVLSDEMCVLFFRQSSHRQAKKTRRALRGLPCKRT